MLRLALPIIIINLSTTMMQFVDAYMVASLGENELAASLPAGLMFFVPIAFFMGVLGSVNTFVSQSLGRGETGSCGHFAWQGIYLGTASGLALLGLWFVAEPMFALFNHEPEVQRLEVVYFRICLFESAPLLVGIALSNFFVGIHRTSLLAWFAVGATLLNILFNWVFIYGKLGFPPLGLAGAALGTVLAVTLQTAGLLIVFMRSSMRREFGTGIRPFDWPASRAMLRIGLPSGVQFGFDIVSWGVALVWMVGMFGTPSLAATTIIVRFMHLSFMPAMALATVLVAMVGKAIGEQNPELASRHVSTALRATMIYMGIVGLSFYLGRRELLGIFSASADVIAIGAGIMACVALFQIFDAMNIVYSHALRGAGDTLWQAVATAALCLTVFLGGGLLIVQYAPKFGALGPWIMGTAYLAVLGISMSLRWNLGPWRRMNIFRETEAPGG